jgi:hypothetical protein
MKRMMIQSTLCIFLGLTSIKAQIPITPNVHSQCDPKIVINPTNVNNYVVATIVNDETIGVYYSSNGGTTWSGSDNVSGSGKYSDPVLAFNDDGVAYLVYMNVHSGVFARRCSKLS